MTDLHSPALCHAGGRRYVVMGATTEVEMPLCARHRRILQRDHRVYTVEAFKALKPRETTNQAKEPETLVLK